MRSLRAWRRNGPRESDSHELVGKTLGRYHILAPLGSGGMGEVYLAQDTTLDRKVALKLLPRQFTKDRDRLRRFEQEARAASALNHPNIITIHEIGEWDGTRFIATEYVEGETLREQLDKAGRSLAEVLEIGIQASGALAAAHDAGIVHRDIKPANIMLRSDGYIKVLDFGLAKLVETARESRRDRSRPRHGHDQLHVARAGDGTAARSSHRHLQSRRGPLRNRHRPASFRRPERSGDLRFASCTSQPPPMREFAPGCAGSIRASHSARAWRKIPRAAIKRRRTCGPI